MTNKENKLSVGIITFQLYEGRRNIGSSRIRGEWLAKYWEDAEIYKQGKKYDVLIFQKAYWVEMAEAFKGIKIFDLCDPDFMHFGYQTKRMIEACDYITTSSEKLAEDIRRFTDKPVLCIPDRMDLKELRQKKVHKGRAKTVVWFGYSHNFDAINTALSAIEKNKLDLIVISNESFLMPMQYVKPVIQVGMSQLEINQVLKEQGRKKHWIDVKNYKWTRETVNDDIIKGDIVINPIFNSGRWKYKSNNKTLTAWALGMPVADNDMELSSFLNEQNRKEESEKRLKEIKNYWDVKISVETYKKIISQINDIKKK